MYLMGAHFGRELLAYIVQMLYDVVISIDGQLYCTLGVGGRPCKELNKGRIQRLCLVHILNVLEFQQETCIDLVSTMLVSMRM